MAGAGFRDWSPGDVPTADQFDTLLQQQTVMVFADAAARDTALSTVKAEGMHAFLRDSNTLTVYSGAAWSTIGPMFGSWTSWTPGWTGLTIGSATVVALYSRVGRGISCYLDVTWAANTSISGDVSFTLPVNHATGVAGMYLGGCTLLDSGGDFFSGAIVSKDADEAYIRRDSTVFQAVSSTQPFTWTTNDRFRSMFNYLADTDA